MTEIKRYIVLANEIRRDILSGKYGTEGGIPSIEELVERSKLSRATVYKALAILESEGLVVSRNRNFYVSQASITMTKHVPTLAERLKASGKIAFTRNLGPIKNATLPDYIADRLKLAHGTPCVYRHRIAGEMTPDGKEKPTRLLNYYYLISLSTEQLERLNTNPETDILRESHPGEMIREDVLSARHLTSDEAKLLGIPQDTPVMSVQIVNTMLDGEYLLVQESVFVGVTFTYKYAFENSPPS